MSLGQNHKRIEKCVFFMIGQIIKKSTGPSWSTNQSWYHGAGIHELDDVIIRKHCVVNEGSFIRETPKVRVNEGINELRNNKATCMEHAMTH